jgi:hypothetical protein
MTQGMSGNDRHPCTLAGELEPSVKGLVAKGRAVPARKDERRSREVDSPSPQPHAFDAFQIMHAADTDERHFAYSILLVTLLWLLMADLLCENKGSANESDRCRRNLTAVVESTRESEGRP